MSLKLVYYILALIAYFKGVADIPYYLITKPIFSIVQVVKKEQAANIEFKIIRLGTFKVLKVKLESKKLSYYLTVYFNLHRSVNKNG